MQTDEDIPVTAYRCRVIYSKEVTRCGFDSIVYGSMWPVYKKVMEYTPSQCRKFVESGQITVLGRTYKITEKGKKEQLIIEKYISHGKFHPEDGCDYETFESGGIKFHNAYEETTVEIQIGVVRGTAYVSTGMVHFSNGIKAKFKDEVISDAVEGIMVWNSTLPNCQSMVSELYYGNATIYTRKRQKNDRDFKEALVMVSNKQTEQFAGLVLRDFADVCTRLCYSTNIKGIIVCVSRNPNEDFFRYSFKPFINPTIANSLTQLSFLHLNTNLRMYGHLEQLQNDICLLDRRTLHNKLQAISGSHNQYSLLDLYGPGHVTFTAGTALYITKCVPVEATRFEYPNCTTEVPVLLNGKKMFADPLTWIVKALPTVLPCSDMMPVKWKIGMTWVCATPKVTICPAPKQLDVTFGINKINDDFTQGLNGGIYTHSQLQQHRQYQLSYSSRDAVVAKVTNAATGFSIEGSGQIGLPIAIEDIAHLTSLVYLYASPFFYYFGWGWNTLVGIMTCVYIIKVLIGILIRMFILYTRRGFGWWMLFALWHTLFSIFGFPLAIVKKAANTLTEDVNGSLREQGNRNNDFAQFENEEKSQNENHFYSDYPRKTRMQKVEEEEDIDTFSKRNIIQSEKHSFDEKPQSYSELYRQANLMNLR